MVSPKAFFGLFLGVYAFTSTLAFFAAPKTAKASGDTEYGKWYNTDEIKLKSVIEVAGSDGVWKNIPFVRVGADSGNFQVKITISLVEPDTLTFAPDAKFGQALRDGVKGPDKYFNNSFGERIMGLAGAGMAYGVGGVKERDSSFVKCDYKDINRFWQSKASILVCKDPKYGKESNDDAKLLKVQAGGEIYNNPFPFSTNDIKNLDFKPGNVYALEFWPNLRVNTGDLGLTESAIAYGLPIAVSANAKRIAGAITGATSKAATLLGQGIDKVRIVPELVKDFVAGGATQAEALKIAEAIVDGAGDLRALSGAVQTEALEKIAEKVIRKLGTEGIALENGGMQTVQNLIGTAVLNKTGSTQIGGNAESIANTVASRIGARAAVRAGAGEAAAKTAAAVAARAGGKIVPFLGWAWTVADILIYVDEFRKDSLPLYPGNMQKVFIQVYGTQAEADAEKDLPPPDEIAAAIAANTGSRTGSPAQTKQEMSGITKLISDLFIGISQLMITFTYNIFYKIVAPMLQGLLSIRVYTDQFVNVIYPGWEILRNVSNIYFIIAIIAIAMATLFRVESYKYKHLLVQLMIAALTVNFSLVIGQAVLGVADTVQNQFLPNNASVIKQLGKDLMPNRIQEIITSSKFASGSFFATASASLFFMSLAFGSFLVFAAILFYLVVRIVMLWILLMLSPLAYAAGVLPSTTGLRAQWWKEFLKYAFFTPIMAFFMNMAALIAVNYEFVFRDINSNIAPSAEWGGFATLVFAVASNMMLLVFLFAAINLAQKFGIFGADVVDKVVKGGIFAPFAGVGAIGAGGAWVGKRAAGRVGRWWNEKTVQWFLETKEGEKDRGVLSKAMFAITNPKNFLKGWEKRAQELKELSQTEAEAGGREVAEQLLTLGKLKMPYRQFTARSHENNFLKDYENMRKESLMAAAVTAEKLGGAEGAIRRRAIVKAAAKQGYLDDLMRMKPMRDKYADADGTYYSAESLNRFLFGYLSDNHGHVDDNTMRFIAEDLEDLGKSVGHFEYLGHAYYDNNTKSWKRGMEEVGEESAVRGGQERKIKRYKNTWQKAYAIGEMKKIPGRDRAKLAPHNFVALRGKLVGGDGTDFEAGDELTEDIYGRANGQLDEYESAATGMMDAAVLQQLSFGQGRSPQRVLSSEIDKITGEVVIRSKEDYNRIKSFWKENAGLTKHYYGMLLGIDNPAERSRLKGIKVVTMEGGIKRDAATYYDSDPNALGFSDDVYSVANTVANDIMKDQKVGLAKVNAQEQEEVRQALQVAVDDVFSGNKDRSSIEANIQTKLSGLKKTEGLNVSVVTKDAVTQVYERISTEIDEKFDPQFRVDEIDRRLTKTDRLAGFSPTENRRLKEAILGGYKAAFVEVAKGTTTMKAVDVRSFVEKAVRAMGDAKINATLTSGDYDTFSNFIKPKTP